jgi:hypothetical protein
VEQYTFFRSNTSPTSLLHILLSVGISHNYNPENPLRTMSNKRSCASTRATDIPFFDAENPLSTMSNKRSCNSARAADSTIIDLDYTTECLFFAATPSSLCGELNVNDANSPGGKRTTRIYSLTTVDMTGQTVVFEYWGANSDKAERYFR